LARAGFIERAETGLVSPYLSLAVKVGLLERIPVFGTKRYVYRHVSPLTDLMYYLDSKYAFYERDIPIEFILKVVKNKISFYIEVFLERFLAEVFGLVPAKSLQPEIDVLLLDFKKPKVVAEVKWSDRVTREEIREAEEKLRAFEDARKILFVKDASGIPETELEVWDVERLKEEVRKRPSYRYM